METAAREIHVDEDMLGEVVLLLAGLVVPLLLDEEDMVAVELVTATTAMLEQQDKNHISVNSVKKNTSTINAHSCQLELLRKLEMLSNRKNYVKFV